MRRAPALLLLLGLLQAGSRSALAQPPGPPGQPPPPPAALQDISRRLKVFIDCGGYWDCDSEYFRTTLTMVDHVRDRAVADVHVLITAQSTGSGGSEVTLAFIGLGPFDRANDVLRYVSPPNSTSDAIRQGLAKKIKLGLVRYLAHSDAADTLQISLAAAASTAPPSPTHDPWDYWVMRVRLNGSMSGESSSSYESFSGGASANRVTDAWKISLSGTASYRESSYDLGEGDPYVSISRDSTLIGKVVKSVGPRWSAALIGSVGSSSYLNKSLYVNVAPGVEYDVFPYSESTRRSLTLQYMVGINTYRYREVTLYDKVSETLPSHSVNLDIEAKQAWGQVSGSVAVLQFLTQPDKYSVQSYGYLDLKLKKGLSFNAGGGVSWIRDQIYLPKGEATTEEILVRQRQLQTSYSYSLYFGVSYTFGSIFNNIVNPRFASGGGTTMIMY